MKTRRYLLLLSCLLLGSSFILLPDWPNLDTLKDYPKVGETCSIDGKSNATANKKAQNRLKNRYRMPVNNVFEEMTIQDIIGLPSGTKVIKPPLNSPNHSRAVSVIGFVKDVNFGGTKGESCNCGATDRGMVDTHIDLVLDGNDIDETGKNLIVAEVTFRTQILAQNGLLASNIGNKWTKKNLRDRLLGRRVKFSGWLFYDYDHHGETWVVDPDNTFDRNNWRATAWEIHPVMAIEVLN